MRRFARLAAVVGLGAIVTFGLPAHALWCMGNGTISVYYDYATKEIWRVVNLPSPLLPCPVECSSSDGAQDDFDPQSVRVENATSSGTFTIDEGGAPIVVPPGMSTVIPITQPYVADWSVDLGGTTPGPGESITLTGLVPDPQDPSEDLEVGRYILDLGGDTVGTPVLVGIITPPGEPPIDIVLSSCGGPMYPELDLSDLAGQMRVAEDPGLPKSGSVSDGSDGAPLLISRVAPLDEIELSWSSSCSAGDTDYRVYRGTIGDFRSHVPVTCSTGGLSSAILDPGPDDAYFLVAPTNEETDGSYGFNSDGEPRLMGPTACQWQSVESCP